MIFDLPDTNTHEISKTLVRIRDTGGQVATSRVLTLIVVASAEDDIDAITQATNDASREHPSRVIVLIQGQKDGDDARLDAEVRIGGDAGASEVILMQLHGAIADNLLHVVTPLLLPDTPIVAWWPYQAPLDPSEDPIGKIAQRRITDALFDATENSLEHRKNNYAPGDSDLAWSRLTPWRGVLASALDQPPHEMIQDIRVYGSDRSPCVDLAAGWLTNCLGVCVARVPTDCEAQAASPVRKVELTRPSGTVVLEALEGGQTLQVSFPGKKPKLVAIPLRTTADCLAEELRHLGPDTAYAETLRALKHVSFEES